VEYKTVLHGKLGVALTTCTSTYISGRFKQAAWAYKTEILDQ
jgi:hypothetical protein